MNDFLSGILVMEALAIGLYQVRFWRRSQDRLFLCFAIGFGLMAANRLALFFVEDEDETRTYLFIVRLLAFVIILWGIWDKNRASRRAKATPPA